MLDIKDILILIISTAGICFLIFEIWTIYCQYDNIIIYNNVYKFLEYAPSANITYSDKSVYDPNDNQPNASNKWRCAIKNNLYYIVSSYGFMSTNSNSIPPGIIDYQTCIFNWTESLTPIVYNPCLGNKFGNDCLLLEELMRNTS